MTVGALLVRHDPASTSSVRHEVANDLNRAGLSPESIDDVLIVVSELVGNAVMHTSPHDRHRDGGRPDGDGLDVAWDLDDGEVTVRVDDGSCTEPVLRPADVYRSGGRGLTIVNALASAWGCRQTRDGKQVWARIPVTRR